MRYSGYLYSILCFLLICVMCSCSSRQHVVRKIYSYDEEIKIEKELEKKLEKQELKVIEEAFEWLNTPYVYGRQEKGVATDCSGFVMNVFLNSIGCKLPRNSAKQAEFCSYISKHAIKPGDLVFFITNGGSKINHVGIMISKDQFIHASSKGVVVSSMEANYYKTHFKQYGRVPCMQH